MDLPEVLRQRVQLLENLLDNLPADLPHNPIYSEYTFRLDPDLLEDGGHFAALGRCLEHTFQTWRFPVSPDIPNMVSFSERGRRLSHDMMQLIHTSLPHMSPSDQTVFCDAWIERLIRSCKSVGAAVKAKPTKRSLYERSPSPGPSAKRRTLPLDSAPHPSSSRIIIRVDAESSDFESSADSSEADSDSDDDPGIDIPKATYPSKNAQQKTLFSSGFKPITAEERLAEIRKVSKAANRRARTEKKKKTISLAAKKEKKRAGNAARQQRYRDRKKVMAQSAAAASTSPIDHAPADTESGMILSSTLGDGGAAVSRQVSSNWRMHRNGKFGGKVVSSTPKRTNYFHPFLWVIIMRYLVNHGWGRESTAKALNRDYPNLFHRLKRGTISNWLIPHTNMFRASVLKNIEAGNKLAGSGRAGILNGHPELKEEIVSTLLSVRKSSLPVLGPLARAIIISIIQARNPDLAAKFKVSETWVINFLASELNWSIRKATRAAAHVPDDWEDQCVRLFFRVVYAVKWDEIHLRLLLNGDQHGNLLLPQQHTTYEVKGSRQIDVQNKDEKRAYTLFVTSSAAGDFLPFQQVWGGKDEKRSLPKKTAPGMKEALERGFVFSTAASEKSPRSHFSTLKTMKEYFSGIIDPYVKRVIQEEKLPEDQKYILTLDAYPGHISQAFRDYVRTKHPNCILLYIPANCTGKFQPADVGLQRPVKHRIKQAQFRALVEEQSRQVRSGITPEKVAFSTSLPVLRDASVQPCVEVYDMMCSDEGRRMVKQAWSLCTAGKWNLGGECIKSREARTALEPYLEEDSQLIHEIRQRMGKVLGVDDAEGDDDDDDLNDDLDPAVPFADVVRDTLNLDIDFPEDSHTVTITKKVDGKIHVGNTEEDIWAYDDDGVAFEDWKVPEDVEDSQDDGSGSDEAESD